MMKTVHQRCSVVWKKETLAVCGLSDHPIKELDSQDSPTRKLCCYDSIKTTDLTLRLSPRASLCGAMKFAASYLFLLLAVGIQLVKSTEYHATSDPESARRERMLAKVLPGNDEEDSDDGGMMEQKNAETQSYDCATHLYVMAFTSGSGGAGSDDSPYLYVHLTNKQGSTRFYDRPGNDMYSNKGDFWRFNLKTDLGLTDSCITKDDVQSIVIQNGGNDGWKIESVMTTLAAGTKYTVVTADIHLNKWVDGNPSGGDSFTSITLSRASD